MHLTTALYALLLTSFSSVASAWDARGAPDREPTREPTFRRLRRAVPSEGYFPPANTNGSMLTNVPDTFPEGQHEPINAIITANSESAVLKDQGTNGGLRNYFTSLGFSSECLGQHDGDNQMANLGDGNGYLNETAVIRWDYGDPALGTCQETIEGGNHFRYWVQNGKSANSGAVFLAASYEKPIAEGHDLIFNSYNLGRDWLIGNATGQSIPTPSVSNTSQFAGSTSFNGYTYKTEVSYVSGLLPNTSFNINHNLTVGSSSVNAVDGLVAVMTVTITAQPAGSSAQSHMPLSHFWASACLLAAWLLLPSSALL